MNPAHELQVSKAKSDDVYRDIVRVHLADRDGMREGLVCRVRNLDSGKDALFAVRGLPKEGGGHIVLDEFGRERLGIGSLGTYRFQFETVSWRQSIQWACGTADPAARIAAWIGVWSLIVGGIAIILGLIAVALTIPPLL